MPSDPKLTHKTLVVTNTHTLNKCIPTEVAVLKAYLQFHFLLGEASATLKQRSVWDWHFFLVLRGLTEKDEMGSCHSLPRRRLTHKANVFAETR